MSATPKPSISNLQDVKFRCLFHLIIIWRGLLLEKEFGDFCGSKVKAGFRPQGFRAHSFFRFNEGTIHRLLD